MESVRIKEVKCNCNGPDFHKFTLAQQRSVKNFYTEFINTRQTVWSLTLRHKRNDLIPHIGRSYPSQGRTKMDIVYDNIKKWTASVV